jgi:non-ribosomal peptide synthetase component F
VALVALAAVVQINTARTDARAKQLYDVSFARSASPEALTAARAALVLRPDVVAYRQRVASLEAARLTLAGDLAAARAILIDGLSYTHPTVNAALREQLAAVNSAKFLNDARKAHVLHGREKPGGVLEPEDLLP